VKVVRVVAIRVFSIVPVALGVLTLTFFVARVVAGDPVELFVPDNANAQQRADIREKFGLDKPIGEQFVLYLSNAVRGDLGESIFTGRPVTDDLRQRLPATFELALIAFAIAVGLGIGIGVLSVIVDGGPANWVLRATTLFGISVPGFWLGLVALYIFSSLLRWFPGPVGRFPIGAAAPQGPTGLFTFDSLLAGNWAAFGIAVHHLVLPAVTLGFVSMAPIARITRSALLEALAADHIRTARALGVPAQTIYFRYALKNAMLPIITILGGTVGFMFGGTVLVESVFNWPGVGQYALGALQRADFPALQGFVIWAAISYVIAYMLVDLLYFAADPRIR
jgi:ABC-type dipeptide/oligopeptide/nickel transport system permease component